ICTRIASQCPVHHFVIVIVSTTQASWGTPFENCFSCNQVSFCTPKQGIVEFTLSITVWNVGFPEFPHHGCFILLVVGGLTDHTNFIMIDDGIGFCATDIHTLLCYTGWFVPWSKIQY